MTETEFIDNVRKRTAVVCVGPSALRKQGAAGIVDKSREYFKNEITLADFFSVLSDQKRFEEYLDQHTLDLVATYAEGGQSWGAARKALNLFFRDVVYNRYLSDFYGLPTDFVAQNIALRNLEVPLDKDVGTNLNEVDTSLPMWKSIKQLDRPTSYLYQAAALVYADTFRIARVHLDLRFWRQNRLTQQARTANSGLASVGLDE